MDRFQILANAIVKQAADDYFNLLAGFNMIPVDTEKLCTKRKLQKFFSSDYYKILTKLNGEKLMKELKDKANNMVLKYIVSKEKNSRHYYIYQLGQEAMPLSKGYIYKEEAQRIAAKMQNVSYLHYKKILQRDKFEC